MRRERIANQVTATVEVTGGKLSAQALIFFVEELERVPDAAIDSALARCRREISNDYGKTLTIKDVLDRAGVSTPEQEIKAAADLAWANVMTCFYTNAYDGEQYLCDRKCDKLMAAGDVRLIHAVRVTGGWRRIGGTDPKDYGYLKRDFTQAYIDHDIARAVELQSLSAGDAKRLLGNLAKRLTTRKDSRL
jgi:hypothetical protein